MGKYSDTFAFKELGVVPEIALAAGSGMINELSKGFTGLLAGAFHGSDAATDVVEGWDNSMVYEPRGEAAQAALQGLGVVMEKWEGVAKEVGDAAEKVGAPPALSTAAYSLVMVIPDLIGLKIGRGIKKGPEGNILDEMSRIDYKKVAKIQKYELKYWFNAVSDPHFLKQMWQKNDPKGYDAAVKAGTVDQTVKVFSGTLKEKLKEIKVEVSKDAFDDTPAGAYNKNTKTIELYPYSRAWKQAEVDVKAGQFAGDRPTWIDRGADAHTAGHELGHGMDNLMWEVLDQGGGSNLTFTGIKPTQNAVWSTAGDFLSSTLPSITKISELFKSDKRVGGARRSVETPEFKEHIDYLSRPQELYVRINRLQRFMLENNLTVRQVIKRYEDGLIKKGHGEGTKKPWAESVGGKKFEKYDLPKDIVDILEPMLEHRNHLGIEYINKEGRAMNASGKGGGSGMSKISDSVPDNVKAMLIEHATFKVSSMLENAVREIAVEGKHLPTELKVGVDAVGKGMIGAVEAVKATDDDPLGLGE
jgi:hypothetical protein